MFDRYLDDPVQRVLAPLARRAGRLGFTPDSITTVGLGLALGCGVAIATGRYGVGLLLIVLNRVADGLDGTLARQAEPTPFGAYFDVLSDFVFYATVPAAFAFAQPSNQPAAVVLIMAFTINGTSFLAFAAVTPTATIETERAHRRTRQRTKGFLYSRGIVEGAETITVFMGFCLFPARFTTIAVVFAALCLITAAQRTVTARTLLSPPIERRPPHRSDLKNIPLPRRSNDNPGSHHPHSPDGPHQRVCASGTGRQRSRRHRAP